MKSTQKRKNLLLILDWNKRNLNSTIMKNNINKKWSVILTLLVNLIIGFIWIAGISLILDISLLSAVGLILCIGFALNLIDTVFQVTIKMSNKLDKHTD